MKLIQPRLNYKLSLKDLWTIFKSFFEKSKTEESGVNSVFNTAQVFFFDYARSGLLIALGVLPRNSRVGIQPFTCPTVLEAIENAGCIPVFIDINEHFVIDSEIVKKNIDKIDALILTHTFGFPADVVKIKSVLKDMLLIEDCAHAFLTKTNDNYAGTTGDFSIFSYGFAKFPSAMQGGFLIVNNLSYSDKIQREFESIKSLSCIQSSILLFKMLVLSFLNTRVIYNLVTIKLKDKKSSKFSYKKHLTDKSNIKKAIVFGKALFESKLLSSNELLEKQKLNGSKIIDALNANNNFKVLQDTKGMNFFMIPVLTDNPEHFINYCRIEGIEVGRHFFQSKMIIPHYNYIDSSCPNYEKYINQFVTISCHYNYPQKKILKLIEIIRKYKK